METAGGGIGGEPDGWANRVTVESGLVEFGPIGRLQSAALVALIWSGLLVLAAAAVREWDRP